VPRNIVVRELQQPAVEESQVELVERKGLGHPDYISDAVAEEASRQLSIYYRERFGTIMHHNLDKVLLVGGQAAPRWGGGISTKAFTISLALLSKLPIQPIQSRYSKSEFS